MQEIFSFHSHEKKTHLSTNKIFGTIKIFIIYDLFNYDYQNFVLSFDSFLVVILRGVCLEV